jgi:DNA-binding response OmpR family regulator
MSTTEVNPAVLIVDDNPDICEILTTLLRTFGHTAIWVQSGEQALDVLKTISPRVVILDMLMPGISGLDVLRQIKAGERSKMRVLMYSALSNPETRGEALKAGADQYIVKGTMDYDTLKTIVKLYIEDISDH